MSKDTIRLDVDSPPIYVGQQFLDKNYETLKITNILKVENKDGVCYVEYEYEDACLKYFQFVFYNRFACETQTYIVKAKNKHVARHLFWEKYPKKSYKNCIEYIEDI